MGDNNEPKSIEELQEELLEDFDKASKAQKSAERTLKFLEQETGMHEFLEAEKNRVLYAMAAKANIVTALSTLRGEQRSNPSIDKKAINLKQEK